MSSCKHQTPPPRVITYPTQEDWIKNREDFNKRRAAERLSDDNIDNLNSYAADSSPNYDSDGSPFSSHNLSSNRFYDLVHQDLNGPIVGCDAANLDGINIDETNNNIQVASLDNLGPLPDSGGRVDTPLPDVEFKDAFKYGYYRYNDGDKQYYGKKRTISRIQNAAKILAAKGMAMGIGDISKKHSGERDSNGRKIRTSGHNSHQHGNDVDFRLMSPLGVPVNKACTIENKSCYDRGKTLEMIKTIIDVDPTKLKVIFINDPELRKGINEYYKAKTKSNKDLAKYYRGHHNHVHVAWTD